MIDFDSLLIEEARKWVGVREKGFNSGPEVEMFQRAVDGKASKEAYCAGFAWYCLKEVEKKTGRKSWLHQSERVLTIWTKSPIQARRLEPEVGLLVCWQFYSTTGAPTGLGHVGICSEILTEKSFKSIEGNTSPGDGVIREGIGVFERERRFAKVGKFRILGFLQPFLQDPV